MSISRAASCWVLLACVAAAQDTGEAELSRLVATLRAARGDEVAKAWWEIEQFVPTATHLPAAARTDALAAGLEIEPVILQVRVLRLLATAPDSARAAHHLLAACRAQDAREEGLASRRSPPPFDFDEARVFGFEFPLGLVKTREMYKTLDDSLCFETRTLREVLLEACRAHVHAETGAGLTLLLRRLAPDPESDPIFAALLEHPPQDAIDGLVAAIEACAARESELEAEIDAARKWRPREKPSDRTHGEWARSEAEVKRKLVRLHQHRLDAFHDSAAAKVDQIIAYAKDHHLPAPPRNAAPTKAWRSWRKAVTKALEKAAGNGG